jgi:multidrug efflux system membrane fusion protein
MHEAAAKTVGLKERRRNWAISLAILLLLFGSGFLLSQHATNTVESGPAGAAKSGRKGGGAIPVSVAKVTQGNIGVYINALGTVTPVYTVTVTSRVVGQLMEVRYREGQIVQKGQVLAVIDARPYQASLMQAQGQLARDQAQLKNANIDLNRYQSVFAQHAIPEQTLATQQALVEQDQGTVKLDQGTLEAAQVNVDYATITSPITGRVGIRTVDPGNIVQANGATGIATITQLQPITVIFTMAEDYIDQVASQLRAGHQLRVDALDRTDETELARGTVLTVDNQIDTTTGTVRVRATFPNRDYRLFPNEFVNARLLVRTLNNVNLIPTAAIQRNNELAFVYVVDPASSSVRARNINIATTSGTTAAVTGVTPGETLVTDGFDRLIEGGKVSTRARPPGGAAAKAGANAAETKAPPAGQ